MVPALTSDQIGSAVEEQLNAISFIDMHTHLFMPSLGRLGLWGIDELVTYHYLEAEVFRSSPMQPAQYWTMSKREQADLIWRTLFVENAPVSEATRGVVAVLQALGLPTRTADLTEQRQYFESQKLEDHITNVLRLAGVSDVVMTNDPLDPAEGPLWEAGAQRDKRFHPVLRLDRVLNKWPDHWGVLQSQGYKVDAGCTGNSVAEIRRFLDKWCQTMRPVYMACSLPDTFRFPEDSIRGRLLHEAVLPACRSHNIPLSLMIGVRYLVNPGLRLAGDASGIADLRSLEYLCREYPENRFLVSVLSRENQHELCVYARKFRNMLPFGCWWFLNNPSVVEEMTRERIEMLGATFVPQHSDARVLEQVIYKWRNTRRTLTPILTNTYRTLAEDGWPVAKDDVAKDIRRMFRDNFEQFVSGRSILTAAAPDAAAL